MAQVNDIGDVDKHFPGLLKATVEWFKIYKIPDGKPKNEFAFDGEAKDAAFATNVVNETHEFWKSLISGEVNSDKISCANTTLADSPHVVSQDDADQTFASSIEGGVAEPLTDAIDTWHFIQLK